MAYTSKFVPAARSIYISFIYIPLLAIGSAIPKDDCIQSSFESEILFWVGSITLFIAENTAGDGIDLLHKLTHKPISTHLFKTTLMLLTRDDEFLLDFLILKSKQQL